jgi:FKBP-type peptidyl-prolyl cis-trans isomerase
MGAFFDSLGTPRLLHLVTFIQSFIRKFIVTRKAKMRSAILTVFACAAFSLAVAQEFKIEVTYSVACDRKSRNGDNIYVNYNGTLTNGSLFDSST